LDGEKITHAMSERKISLIAVFIRSGMLSHDTGKGLKMWGFVVIAVLVIVAAVTGVGLYIFAIFA